MGGGNGQKAKMAREKNLEKQKAAGKGSQLEANKKVMSIQVLDEADRLLNEEFEESIDNILKAIPQYKTYLFSATMTKKGSAKRLIKTALQEAARKREM
ncbi:hypothetical protein IFM89_029728 [Coptis chinensis]|uniref:DEAD/DEAH-box helicase domain-containing protein n=1 Tax=Coptis chinensis TaxID=261450 RepID=A0A835LXK7_9MAGN|nr:hypothetical protein IFM89_029728 [Coptis chinensis]